MIALSKKESIEVGFKYVWKSSFRVFGREVISKVTLCLEKDPCACKGLGYGMNVFLKACKI